MSNQNYLHISKQGEEKVLYTENDRKNIKRKKLFQKLNKAIEIVQIRQDLVQQKAMLDEEIEKADQEIYKIKNANWMDSVRYEILGLYNAYSGNQSQRTVLDIENQKLALIEEREEIIEEIAGIDESEEMQDIFAFLPESYRSLECVEAFRDILETSDADSFRDIFMIYEDGQLKKRMEKEYKAKYEAAKTIVNKAQKAIDDAALEIKI